MATVKSFEELEIWQLAKAFFNEIIVIVNTSKLKTDYKLRDQIERSAGSVMDNIAEGFGRASRLEFIQFLTIAQGSLNESISQLFQLQAKEYITPEKFEVLKNDARFLENKIGALIRYLNKSAYKGQKFMNRTTKPEQQTTNRNVIKTSSAASPLGAYPHARKVGDLLFLSGIGSRRASDNVIPGLELDPDGNIIKYDIEAECHAVFANVKAVLEASGSSWEKIVDVTVFLTNMKKDFPVYNKIYGEYFKDVEACRTTVEVKSLPTPIAIELKVIATI